MRSHCGRSSRSVSARCRSLRGRTRRISSCAASRLASRTPDETVEFFRGAIRAYNEATGVENTTTSGYHETLTRYYVGAVASLGAAPLDQVLTAPQCTTAAPLGHWSRAALFSPEARADWIDPDLAPLPWPRIEASSNRRGCSVGGGVRPIATVGAWTSRFPNRPSNCSTSSTRSSSRRSSRWRPRTTTSASSITAARTPAPTGTVTVCPTPNGKRCSADARRR